MLWLWLWLVSKFLNILIFENIPWFLKISTIIFANPHFAAKSNPEVIYQILNLLIPKSQNKVYC